MMNRRELILALAGTLTAPCVPRAQQTSLDQLQAGALVVGTNAFFASQRSHLVAPILLKNYRF